MIILALMTLMLIVASYFVFKYWYRTYNKFQRLGTKAQNYYANIGTVRQKRLDNIQALAQIVDKYHLHEYETLKEVIQARGYKDAENSIIRLNAVFERYPELKADVVFMSFMERDSNIENQLMDTRLLYNRSAEQYNETLRQFPQNIIAYYHRFKEMTYLYHTNQEHFNPSAIFSN